MEALFIIGRIILGGYFIWGGVSHFLRLDSMSGYAKSRHIPAPKLSVALSGLMLLVGGLTILFNFYTVIGLWLLIIFLLVTTLTIHQFWTEKDPMRKMGETINFNKNFALIGALLLIIVGK